MLNFLPSQYSKDEQFPINHNYLRDQFADRQEIWRKIEEVVIRGDFTLGSAVDRLEENFAKLLGAKYAIGVGSGTDAIFLSLRALDLQPGDEVITTPFTFYATIGAIVTAGGTPVFCDIGDDFNIDALSVRNYISPKTKAIVPVHWSGRPCNMDEIMEISTEFNIPVIEDACHSILASSKGQHTGTFGITGCFSFHPLKNLNVWGDGGIITTNSEEMYNKIRLLRNHGLKDRDNCAVFAYNSRLDSVQAVVATHMLEKIVHITESRIKNAKILDSLLGKIKQVTLPLRENHLVEVFHIYSFMAEQRDDLQSFLCKNGIDAKIHYPKSMHLQEAAGYLGYKQGDFPKSEFASSHTISLPVHEFIQEPELLFMVEKIREFYEYD
jgi:dTDP-4-amino-4,6-dideoxygalactose transaminase